jgi:dUTP pyrophosphatase
MIIKIKKLHSEAVIPTYAKYGDAGLDLTAVAMNINEEGGYVEYNTGLAVEIPYGYVGLLFPRSSVTKTDFMLGNSVGVLDAGYRGEISFRFRKVANTRSMYSIGDRVGQLVIIPFPQITPVEVTSLSDSDRGVGKYGSTGA